MRPSLRSLFRNFVQDFEAYFCSLLLAVFVTLLFAQVVSRELFGHSIAWTEELSVYLFVWFAYFGASLAVRRSAHNRITQQYRLLPGNIPVLLELLADVVWLIFSLYVAYLSFDFVFFRINEFWKSQTLGISMAYVYLVLPLSFTLMAIRLIQNNYQKFFGESPQAEQGAPNE